VKEKEKLRDQLKKVNRFLSLIYEEKNKNKIMNMNKNKRRGKRNIHLALQVFLDTVGKYFTDVL
jgi:uncharacterized protein YutE (UPF0331/DUF86 family)